MSRPASGTPCMECHGRGHFCEAQIVVGDEALCLDCADEVPCAIARAANPGIVATAKLPANAEVCEYCGPNCRGGAAHNARVEDGARYGAEEVVISPHAVMGPEMIDPRARLAELATSSEEKEVSEVAEVSRLLEASKAAARERSGWRPISAEVKKAICSEDPSISHEAVARKYGVSGVSVGLFRKQAGIKMPAVKDRARRVCEEDSSVAAPVKTAPSITIPFELSDEDCNLFFAGLDTALKAKLLKTVLRERLGL